MILTSFQDELILAHDNGINASPPPLLYVSPPVLQDIPSSPPLTVQTVPQVSTVPPIQPEVPELPLSDSLVPATFMPVAVEQPMAYENVSKHADAFPVELSASTIVTIVNPSPPQQQKEQDNTVIYNKEQVDEHGKDADESDNENVALEVVLSPDGDHNDDEEEEDENNELAELFGELPSEEGLAIWRLQQLKPFKIDPLLYPSL